MLSAEDRIIRGKVKLQKEQPFFAYLVLHLTPIKKDEVLTMGVDAHNNLYYNKKFVESLDERDVILCLTHEVLHIALMHLTRRGKRDPRLWNFSADLIVNKILELNFREDFYCSKLRELGVTEETLREYNIKIENLEEKVVEEVYSILEKHMKKNKKFRNLVEGYKFDEHFDLDSLSEEAKKKLERSLGKPFEKIKKDIEKEIRKRVVEANNFSKFKGNAPLGLERYFDKLLDFKLNWRALLRKTICDNIPYDFSYKFPSRKSIAVGTYLPTTIKDKKLEVVCVVDLSGSISDDEMREFMTEVINIAKSFRNVKMTVLTHDYDLQDRIEVENGNINKLMNIKLHGYGGTSHKWLPEYLRREMPHSRLIICLSLIHISEPTRPY